MGKKSDKKTNAEQIAREAGKVAARAESAARDAMDRASALSNMLLGYFGKPGEYVAGGLGTAFHAGQGAIGSVGAGVTKLIGTGEDVAEGIDARMQSAINSLGVPSRAEIERLRRRVEDLEARLEDAVSVATGAKYAAKKPAKKAAAKKTGAKKAAKKPAKKAASKKSTAKKAAPTTASTEG